jgi:hypothetical protein
MQGGAYRSAFSAVGAAGEEYGIRRQECRCVVQDGAGQRSALSSAGDESGVRTIPQGGCLERQVDPRIPSASGSRAESAAAAFVSIGRAERKALGVTAGASPAERSLAQGIVTQRAETVLPPAPKAVRSTARRAWSCSADRDAPEYSSCMVKTFNRLDNPSSDSSVMTHVHSRPPSVLPLGPGKSLVVHRGCSPLVLRQAVQAAQQV